MDTSIGSCALSACEVVAALAGRPSEELTAEVLAWVDEHGDIDVIPFRAIAIRAVDLLMGENSELHDRWQESDGYTTWSARVMDLKRRLESIAEK